MVVCVCMCVCVCISPFATFHACIFKQHIPKLDDGRYTGPPKKRW